VEAEGKADMKKWLTALAVQSGTQEAILRMLAARAARPE